jgi:putative transposase
MTLPFPPRGRLHHNTPAWVDEGATFHIRIRCAQAGQGKTPQMYLTDPRAGHALLDSVRLYHQMGRWHCHLFLLMPDHLHALLAFPHNAGLAAVVKRWKSFHSRSNNVSWQDGFFDHRIRNEREFELKAHYIRQNPVVKGLCAREEDWPWVLDHRSL